MVNTPHKFSGQQEGEKVLFHGLQHAVALVPGTVKVLGLGAAIIAGFSFLGSGHAGVVSLGVLLGLVVWALGIWAIFLMQGRNMFYITDRRIVRFEATTPFSTGMRSLGWDDTVKVKTYAPSLFWKLFNVGNVIVHAKSTFIHPADSAGDTVMTNDDIDLRFTHFYADLGHYIDKILYLHKNKPDEVAILHPFVEKPRGERY